MIFLPNFMCNSKFKKILLSFFSSCYSMQSIQQDVVLQVLLFDDNQ